MDEQIVPMPRDGAEVVVVAVDAVALTWISESPGVPGDGQIAGDGSPESKKLVAEVRRLWEDPISVDHPSWRRPVLTHPGTATGVLATLLHLGHGRARILQAPEDAVEDLFDDAPDYTEEAADVQG